MTDLINIFTAGISVSVAASILITVGAISPALGMAAGGLGLAVGATAFFQSIKEVQRQYVL